MQKNATNKQTNFAQEIRRNQEMYVGSNTIISKCQSVPTSKDVLVLYLSREYDQSLIDNFDDGRYDKDEDSCKDKDDGDVDIDVDDDNDDTNGDIRWCCCCCWCDEVDVDADDDADDAADDDDADNDTDDDFGDADADADDADLHLLLDVPQLLLVFLRLGLVLRLDLLEVGDPGLKKKTILKVKKLDIIFKDL